MYIYILSVVHERRIICDACRIGLGDRGSDINTYTNISPDCIYVSYLVMVTDSAA